jgi:amino acid permease
MTLENYLFGPLNTEYCAYFYFLSIFGFISLLIMIMSFIFMIFERKLDTKVAITVFMTSMVYFLVYFQNRLLYSMCVNKGRDSFVPNDDDKKKKKE